MLSAGREQEETTAKQASPISVENFFMAISYELNFRTAFMRAGILNSIGKDSKGVPVSELPEKSV